MRHQEGLLVMLMDTEPIETEVASGLAAAYHILSKEVRKFHVYLSLLNLSPTV